MLFEYTATLTVDGSGDLTTYLGSKISGIVRAIKYAPGTLDTNADLAITGETTGVPILTKANAGTSTVWFYPRVLVNKNTDGAAATDAFTDIRLFKERIKVIVAQGGNALSGTITFYIDQ